MKTNPPYCPPPDPRLGLLGQAPPHRLRPQVERTVRCKLLSGVNSRRWTCQASVTTPGTEGLNARGAYNLLGRPAPAGDRDRQGRQRLSVIPTPTLSKMLRNDSFCRKRAVSGVRVQPGSFTPVGPRRTPADQHRPEPAEGARGRSAREGWPLIRSRLPTGDAES